MIFKVLPEKLYKTDEFGVKNYHPVFLGIVAISILYTVIAFMAFLLLWFENNTPGANIHHYADAFWTLQMSASTIGFGDFYPVSLGGRTVVAIMFYVGIGIIGFIGAQIANQVLKFADTSIKNRELRQQNIEILAQHKLLEMKLTALSITLDRVINNSSP